MEQPPRAEVDLVLALEPALECIQEGGSVVLGGRELFGCATGLRDEIAEPEPRESATHHVAPLGEACELGHRRSLAREKEGPHDCQNVGGVLEGRLCQDFAIRVELRRPEPDRYRSANPVPADLGSIAGDGENRAPGDHDGAGVQATDRELVATGEDRLEKRTAEHAAEVVEHDGRSARVLLEAATELRVVAEVRIGPVPASAPDLPCQARQRRLPRTGGSARVHERGNAARNCRAGRDGDHVGEPRGEVDVILERAVDQLSQAACRGFRVGA